jgi:hypothetical protein
MKPIRTMTQFELAAYVQTHLRARGIDVILSGGASVAFYSSNQYVSADLDLVNAYFAKSPAIRETMLALGFTGKGRYFIHPDSEFFVEFPPGPLAVGEEPVKAIDQHVLETGTLRIISPTDCVKDRLLGYFHWNDQQSLAQAILVARMNPIDLQEIERWVKVEGKEEMYRAIQAHLLKDAK